MPESPGFYNQRHVAQGLAPTPPAPLRPGPNPADAPQVLRPPSPGGLELDTRPRPQNRPEDAPEVTPSRFAAFSPDSFNNLAALGQGSSLASRLRENIPAPHNRAGSEAPQVLRPPSPGGLELDTRPRPQNRPEHAPELAPSRLSPFSPDSFNNMSALGPGQPSSSRTHPQQQQQPQENIPIPLNRAGSDGPQLVRPGSSEGLIPVDSSLPARPAPYRPGTDPINILQFQGATLTPNNKLPRLPTGRLTQMSNFTFQEFGRFQNPPSPVSPIGSSFSSPGNSPVSSPGNSRPGTPVQIDSGNPIHEAAGNHPAAQEAPINRPRANEVQGSLAPALELQSNRPPAHEMPANEPVIAELPGSHVFGPPQQTPPLAAQARPPLRSDSHPVRDRTLPGIAEE